MKLSTTYLGLELKSPIIVSSSSLTGNVESIKRCAEAGAGAVVLKSIFEEQVESEIRREKGYSDVDIYDSCPEVQEYLNTHKRGTEIEFYEGLIRESKEAVDIPIIASIRKNLLLHDIITLEKELKSHTKSEIIPAKIKA